MANAARTALFQDVRDGRAGVAIRASSGVSGSSLAEP